MTDVSLPYSAFYAADMHLRISAEDYQEIESGSQRMLPSRKDLIQRILHTRRALGMSMDKQDVIAKP
jgi:hypothetical protein